MDCKPVWSLQAICTLVFALFVSAPSAHAQSPSRISFCLNLAHGIEDAAFKAKKQYITKEDDLRKQLTSACAPLRYQFNVKSDGGFRVTAEEKGESWSIDDQKELLQIASANDPKPAVGAAGDKKKDGDKSSNPDEEASRKMEKCFIKVNFNSKPCRTLFDELEKTCGQEGVPLTRLCLELESATAKIDLADCIGDDENWGKCEIRRRQLVKKCTNPLRAASGECRGLMKFTASLLPPTGAAKPTAVAATGNAAGAAEADKKTTKARQPAAVPPVKETHVVAPEPLVIQQEKVDASTTSTLDPSLRTLLRLRPVIYESKMSKQKEMGFVSEEVELVNPMLVTYNDKGQAQTVKFSQFTALITSGVQELYSQCKADGELQKDLIRRIITLEAEHGHVKKSNEELKKQLFNLANDVQELKDKLGRK